MCICYLAFSVQAGPTIIIARSEVLKALSNNYTKIMTF